MLLGVLAHARAGTQTKTYEFYCNGDATAGKLYDPATNCAPDCKAEDISKGQCACSWIPCGAGATPPTPTAPVEVTHSRCTACESASHSRDGPRYDYILYDGHCYVDSIFPVTFNLVLWMGVFLGLGLILTCYAIGGMDPGRNGIVYRMTSQRPKVH